MIYGFSFIILMLTLNIILMLFQKKVYCMIHTPLPNHSYFIRFEKEYTFLIIHLLFQMFKKNQIKVSEIFFTHKIRLNMIEWAQG